MMDEKTRLGELREEIDALDQQIMELISARAKCAQEVANVKMAANPGEDVFFYRPEREAQVLRRIKEKNPGPLPSEEMARLFREIMSACLALEKPCILPSWGLWAPLPRPRLSSISGIRWSAFHYPPLMRFSGRWNPGQPLRCCTGGKLHRGYD